MLLFMYAFESLAFRSRLVLVGVNSINLIVHILFRLAVHVAGACGCANDAECMSELICKQGVGHLFGSDESMNCCIERNSPLN